MVARTPLAFLSYAHFDDAHENGKLHTFAERLSGEVRLQWGEEFPIFIDRNDLKWGQRWKERIDESLDGVTLLIPILTPSYFKSEWCRKELLRFREREKKLHRGDLILPVYYIRSPILEEEAKCSGDEVARVLAERQYHDWRSLRHEIWTTPEAGRRFEQMAVQIIETLERGGSAQPVETAVTVAADPVSETAAKSAALPLSQEGSGRAERPTFIVDALYREKPNSAVEVILKALQERKAACHYYTTISEAIRKAPPGTRILVRPGHYREGLVIEKQLEIAGEGNREDIVVEAAGKDTLLFTASMGRVANMTLRQSGGGRWYAVDIAQGALELEDCDITSQSLSAVAIHGAAEPRIRRNRIHDGRGGGIVVYENGAGLIENNDIFANDCAGIAIATEANPTLRGNRIHNGRGGGVVVSENGAGIVDDNDITSNGHSGIEVSEGGNPIVVGNRISGNGKGIWVHAAGLGSFERNVLKENRTSDWDIDPDCRPKVKHSRNTPEP